MVFFLVTTIEQQVINYPDITAVDVPPEAVVAPTVQAVDVRVVVFNTVYQLYYFGIITRRFPNGVVRVEYLPNRQQYDLFYPYHIVRNMTDREVAVQSASDAVVPPVVVPTDLRVGMICELKGKKNKIHKVKIVNFQSSGQLTYETHGGITYNEAETKLTRHCKK